MDSYRRFVMTGIAVLCFGCGGGVSDRPELGEVQGVVKFNGLPAGSAMVTFIPENGRPSFGVTDAEGKYQLMYINDIPGAAIGQHEVRITTFNPSTEMVTVPEKFPAKYNSKSVLTAEVQAGKNTIDFNLESDSK